MKKQDLQYRGASLTEADQKKIEAEQKAHEDDVTHVQYRGAEDDIKINKEPEKHLKHVKYRGGEDDVMV